MTTEVRDRERREDSIRRFLWHGCFLLGVALLASAIAPNAPAQQPEPAQVTKPFLIVEGQLDRDASTSSSSRSPTASVDAKTSSFVEIRVDCS